MVAVEHEQVMRPKYGVHCQDNISGDDLTVSCSIFFGEKRDDYVDDHADRRRQYYRHEDTADKDRNEDCDERESNSPNHDDGRVH